MVDLIFDVIILAFALFVARRLSPLDGVLATSTHFVLTRYKEGGVSFKDDEIDERRGMLSD